MKLTKQQRKLHEQALERLEQDTLHDDDREFIYRNLRPEATTDIGKGSAFFTPWEIAGDFCIETLNYYGKPKKVLDLCAGYGILSLRSHLRCYREDAPEITCVEINPEYVEIGKKLLPEARWILGDVFDLDKLLPGERFDEFYANSPFGSIPKSVWNGRPGKPPKRFEYAVAEIGMSVADTGTMIVCQGATNWRMSNMARGFEDLDNPDYEKWSQESGLVLAPNCGIDCSHTPFASTSIQVEIACVDRREDYYGEETADAAVEQGTLF